MTTTMTTFWAMIALSMVGAYTVGLWLAIAIHFVYCRFTANPCPGCGERWFTEVVGEWDGVEERHCGKCNNFWMDQS